MQKLTKNQKLRMRRNIAFWAVHAVHWYGIVLFCIITLGLIYIFYGNDAVFAQTILGL